MDMNLSKLQEIEKDKGSSAVLQFTGSQGVGHDGATEQVAPGEWAEVVRNWRRRMVVQGRGQKTGIPQWDHPALSPARMPRPDTNLFIQEFRNPTFRMSV